MNGEWNHICDRISIFMNYRWSVRDALYIRPYALRVSPLSLSSLISHISTRTSTYERRYPHSEGKNMRHRSQRNAPSDRKRPLTLGYYHIFHDE